MPLNDLDKLITNEAAPGGGDFFSTLVQKMRKGGEAASALPSKSWHEGHEEGQLAVDVAQTDQAIVITSTIAGVKPEDISININNDLLTIRGRREKEVELKEEDYFYKECYWGSFSRTIVLPVDVLTDAAAATFKNGVLTIVIPKEASKKEVKIKVVED
jgi:HSP20 family protein